MKCLLQLYIAHQWISFDVRSRYIKLMLVNGDTKSCVDVLYDTQEGEQDMREGNVGEKYEKTGLAYL